MSSRTISIARAVCPICNYNIPKRVTYLYEEILSAWICKSCWHQKYDSKRNTLEVANG
jgi:Zn ribbon nucleic-acid-binding protein